MMAVTSETPSSPVKERKPRTTASGVRVIHGRVYDPQNGKSCHQCRQKTLDFAATCKNLKGAKHCTINFCYKCLFNRYGEKAEEMQALDDWKCPKCRGICNCSLCMKRRGHKPTGILVHKAKAIGFSSVSEMLLVNGAGNALKDVDQTSEVPACLDKDPVSMSPNKLEQENYFFKDNDLKICQSSPDSKQRKHQALDKVDIQNGDEPYIIEKRDSKKPKLSDVSFRTELKEEEIGDGTCSNVDLLNGIQNNVGAELNKVLEPFEEKNFTMPVQSVENSSGNNYKDAAVANDVDITLFKAKSSTMGVQDVEDNDGEKSKDVRLDNCADNNGAGAKLKKTCRPRKLKNSLTVESKERPIDIPLPEGAELTSVAGLDLLPKDAPDVLQFLEFCASMGEAIGIKKSQSESLLRELFRGRPSRHGQYSQYSSIIRLHVKLLSLILEDLGEKPPSSRSRGKNSWLQALGKYVSKSPCAPYSIPSDCFAEGGDGYDNLDFSRKLRLLNFLCDEALQTTYLRDWIDKQNSKFAENQKEAKRKVLAAKERKKEIKQKLHNSLAEAVAEKNGAPLSISEHESIISQIESEAADAHEKILEAEGLVSKNGHVSDALRTQPVILDDNGRVFWKLNSYTGELNLLRQDVGTWDANVTDEKWFAYNAEQKDAVEQYIASIRVKRARTQKAAELVPDIDDEID